MVAVESRPQFSPDLSRAVASILVTVIGAMVFLPSVTFSVLTTEIFPWAILFVIMFGKRIDRGVFVASVYLVAMTIGAIAFTPDAAGSESLRSLAAYLNCLLIFGVLTVAPPSSILRMTRIAVGVFVILLVLGVLQLSGLIEPLDGIFKMLVPRASSTSLSFMGGRGATLLSSEPARAGIELVSMYIVFRVAVFRERRDLQLLGDVLLGLYMIFVIKSAQATIFYLVFLAVFYHVRAIKILPFLALGVFLAIRADVSLGRVVTLVQELFEQGALSDALFIVSNTSGHRVTSIIASYGYGFSHPLGGGIGNWMSSSIVALNQSGISLGELNYFKLYGAGFAVPIRSSGYLTNLILDIGVVGIMPVLYILGGALRRMHAFDRAAMAVTVVFLLKICFFGSVGNPVAWVSVVLCLRMLENRGSGAAPALSQVRESPA